MQDVFYSVHVKRDAPEDHPRTMRIDYRCGLNDYHSEWVCPEHTGYARSRFEAWWRARSIERLPDTAEEAVALAEAGALAVTRVITVRSVAGEKYDRIIDYKLGPIPPRPDDGGDDHEDGALPVYDYADDESVPF